MQQCCVNLLKKTCNISENRLLVFTKWNHYSYSAIWSAPNDITSNPKEPSQLTKTWISQINNVSNSDHFDLFHPKIAWYVPGGHLVRLDFFLRIFRLKKQQHFVSLTWDGGLTLSKGTLLQLSPAPDHEALWWVHWSGLASPPRRPYSGPCWLNPYCVSLQTHASLAFNVVYFDSVIFTAGPY